VYLLVITSLRLDHRLGAICSVHMCQWAPFRLVPTCRPLGTQGDLPKKINGSEIGGGGNLSSRSGVACGSAGTGMHHCCSPFKDADRDLLRPPSLLATSAQAASASARVQFRSDVDGSWSRPTSFLPKFEIDVGFWFHLLTSSFWAAGHRRGRVRPGFGPSLRRRSCELSYARVSQSGFYNVYRRACA
jgi:hypothetical protein